MESLWTSIILFIIKIFFKGRGSIKLGYYRIIKLGWNICIIILIHISIIKVTMNFNFYFNIILFLMKKGKKNVVMGGRQCPIWLGKFENMTSDGV